MTTQAGDVSVTIRAELDQLEQGLKSARAQTEKFNRDSNAKADAVGAAWTQAGSKTKESIKQTNESLKAQQDELGKLLGKINPVVNALDKLDKQEAKLRSFRASGVLDADTYIEYKKRIDDSRKSLVLADDAINRAGNTAKQTAQALRLLPAQISDIVISLQGGQNPLSVFLQQGSQIKESFGGIGPAFRETAKFAARLINPITAVGAGVIALTVAFAKGQKEASDFNKALILTGNSAGTSVSQLQNMAEAMDEVNGTQRHAAEALAIVAGTGKFTKDQLQGIASAAVAMNEATGKAIEDTVSEFVRLADEPAKAAAKLNEQYHFLTASVFEQITALEKQGDAAGAAQLAIDAFAQTMQKRSAEIEEGLGLIEKAWLGIKHGAGEAWDEMLGVGRSQTPEQRLDELISGPQRRPYSEGVVLGAGPVGGAVSAGRLLLEQVGTEIADRNKAIGEVYQEIQARDEKAWVEGMKAQQESDAISAQQRIDELNKSTLSNFEKRQKALSDLTKDLNKIRLVNPEDPRLESGNVARLQKNIAEQFKDPKGPRDEAERLAQQRARTLKDIQEEIRILDSLGNQYIKTGMSTEQMRTSSEALHVLSDLQIDANSREGESLISLIEKKNQLSAAIDAETEARERLEKAKKEFTADIEGIERETEALRIETETVGKSEVAAKEFRMEQELLNKTMENFGSITGEQSKKIRETVDAYGKQATKLETAKKKQQEMEKAADRAAEAQLRLQEKLADGLTDAIFNANSAGDAFHNLAFSIAKAVVQAEILALIQAGTGTAAGGASGGKGSTLLNIASAFAGYFSGGSASSTNAGAISSVMASQMHTGGIGGVDGTRISAPASMFINAPRFHNGLKPDEFPAVLQKGEQVIPRNEVGKASAPVINVSVNGMQSAGEVRRSAAQGAREALALFAETQRSV